MQSVSLFEQLTRHVPLSIVSGAVLALILISTIACRVFFFSTKSKPDAKTNEKKAPTKKQPNEAPSGNKKKTTKAKKNVVPVSSSSPSSQSDESGEEEKTTVIPQTKKAAPSNQVSKDKKAVVSTKQTPTNPTDVQDKNADNKKKQSKTSGVAAATGNEKVTNNKQGTSGKGDATNKSNKKQSAVAPSEVKSTSIVDAEGGSDQEDDGRWVTQSNKQVNNRNRTKGKAEASTSSAPTNNRSTLPEKHVAPSTTTTTTNEVEPSTHPTTPPEPIEVCQLIPKNESRYTANDSWWKQALNHKQTFSVNDIGEWPERELDEQYTVQVKRITPVQNRNDA